MKKFLSGFIGLFLLLFLVSSASAYVEVQEDGTTVGGVAIRLNLTGHVGVSGTGGDKTIDIKTTSAGTTVSTETIVGSTKTVTVAESGTRFIATGDAVYTLPTASTDGLTYTFIVAPGYTVSVDPSPATNTIKYSPANSALSAGDKMTSEAITGESVTLICGDAVQGLWFIEQLTGNWTDGD